MKKVASIFLTAISAITLIAISACGTSGEDAGTGAHEWPLELVAVFSGEFAEHDFILTDTAYLPDDRLTPEIIAEGLSDWTGFDFLFDASYDGAGNFTVDWHVNSTLIAGLGGREQKDGFYMADDNSMRWFMMDTLDRTLKENLEVYEIYYTTDGGKELKFEEFYPINAIPSYIPYMGSSFYFRHAESINDGDLILDVAFTLARSAMEARGEDAPVMAHTGEQTINGELCFTFSAGDMSEDGKKFTAMYHYAVNKSWTAIYFMDAAEGADWAPAAAG